MFSNLALVVDHHQCGGVLKLCRRSIDVERGGVDDPAIVAALCNPAHATRGHGALSDGVSLYREALAMQRRLQGDEHGDVDRGLGDVLYESGDVSSASS